MESRLNKINLNTPLEPVPLLREAGGMKPEFSKYPDGLVPTIVQDDETGKVLMLGFMNEEALARTQADGKLTFYSRSKKRLWTKGESSGNYILVKVILADCDNDTLLIKARPTGPVCHTGSDTCFNELNPAFGLNSLERIISDRKLNAPASSYTSDLFAKGINKIAQKVGEESVELIIESTGNDHEKFLEEASDLLFHYLILLHAKNFCLDDVVRVLETRNKNLTLN